MVKGRVVCSWLQPKKNSHRKLNMLFRKDMMDPRALTQLLRGQIGQERRHLYSTKSIDAEMHGEVAVCKQAIPCSRVEPRVRGPFKIMGFLALLLWSHPKVMF